jgi:hypothetical protein
MFRLRSATLRCALPDAAPARPSLSITLGARVASAALRPEQSVAPQRLDGTRIESCRLDNVLSREIKGDHAAANG